MADRSLGVGANWQEIWLLDGIRTPFADYGGPLAPVSPTDLGIKVAREVFKRSGIAATDVDAVVTGSMAQASFDTYCLPRHIGLYSGVSIETPAIMVQRVCGTGIEILMQAADAIAHRGADLALCVGTESMSRNPVASYTIARLPHGPGRVQGFPVGGAARSRPRRHHGRHRREPGATHIRSPGRKSTPTPRAASSARWRRRRTDFSRARSCR